MVMGVIIATCSQALAVMIMGAKAKPGFALSSG